MESVLLRPAPPPQETAAQILESLALQKVVLPYAHQSIATVTARKLTRLRREIPLLLILRDFDVL